MNKVTLTFTDVEDGSVDLSIDSENSESTPAVNLAKKIFKLIQQNLLTYSEPVESEEVSG